MFEQTPKIQQKYLDSFHTNIHIRCIRNPYHLDKSKIIHQPQIRQYGGFHKWGTQNGWFIRENPIKMDDLGVPPFEETPILGHCTVLPC